MEWYGIIRHSVDTKFMVRFPKHCLLIKAQMLQQEYCAACLRSSTVVDPVEITMRWLNQLLHEYRISELRPNRKFKGTTWDVLAVSRAVAQIHIASVRL